MFGSTAQFGVFVEPESAYGDQVRDGNANCSIYQMGRGNHLTPPQGKFDKFFAENPELVDIIVSGAVKKYDLEYGVSDVDELPTDRPLAVFNLTLP